jgi:hypothetical protein
MFRMKRTIESALRGATDVTVVSIANYLSRDPIT